MTSPSKSNIATLRISALFKATVFILLFLFLFVQVHEFIPFMHHHVDPNIPEEYCPLCVIKYVLSFSLSLALAICFSPRLNTKTQPRDIRRNPFVLATLIPARAPPCI